MGWFDILKNLNRITLNGVEYELNEQQRQEWNRLAAENERNPNFMRLNDGGRKAREQALRRVISQFRLKGKDARQAAAERMRLREEENAAFSQEERMKF